MKIKKCFFSLEHQKKKYCKKDFFEDAKYQNNFEDSFEVSSTINEDLS